MNLFQKLRWLNNLGRLVKHVRSLPPLRPFHRDDVPMEIAAAIDRASVESAGQRAVWAGDIPDGHPMKKAVDTMARGQTLLRDAKLLMGVCGTCNARYQGEFPPPSNAAFISAGWMVAKRDTAAEQLICGDCVAKILEGSEQE